MVFSGLLTLAGIGIYSYLFRKTNGNSISIAVLFVIFLGALILCIAIGIMIEQDKYLERMKSHD